MTFNGCLFQLFRLSLKHPIQNKCLLSSFQSSISLSKLYPGSSLDFTTPFKLPEKENVKFNGFIPIDKLSITYSKSSGPGGQHINNVNTKVDIRFNLDSAEWLDGEIKKKMADLFKTRINKDGFFIVRSDKTRSQIYNQADAITMLREMIFAAVKACEVQTGPSPETLHVLRKRKELANIQRLANKKNHSLKKVDRKTPEI